MSHSNTRISGYTIQTQGEFSDVMHMLSGHNIMGIEHVPLDVKIAIG